MIGSTGPVRKFQQNTPRTLKAAVTANDQKKWPVRSNRKPVTTEAIAPEEFPKAHCKPVHSPEARGPASVWAIGHILAIVKPTDAPTSNSSATESAGPASTLARRNTEVPSNPADIRVMCTLVREAPAAIQRSLIRPQAIEHRACVRNTAPPILAIESIEKCLSRTR